VNNVNNVNVYFSPEYFADVSNPFSALPGSLRVEPTDDADHRNGETPDLVREKRAKRRSRRERKTADPALVASLRAGVDALRAARAKVAREERAREERAALRDDPAWQAEQAALQAERAAARAARAARLAHERAAGAKTEQHWASRDAMLNRRAKVGWRVLPQHEPFPSWGKLVRGYATNGELDAAREAATLAGVFERFVSFARAKLARAKPLAVSERAVLERLMALDPPEFAALALVARSIMDE
jgi:hypothetical protein